MKDEERTRREIETAIGLMSKGNISKAVKRLRADGLVDLANPLIRAQLEKKHPTR